MAFEGYDVWDSVKQAKYRRVLDELKKNIEASKDDIYAILDYALKTFCDATQTVAGTFWYYDINGDGMIRPAAVYGGTDISSIRLKLGEGITGKVIETGEPYKAFDAQSDINFSKKSDDETGFVTKSVICVPLTVNKYTFGCIQLINKKDDSFYDDKDLELVETLAVEISAIIDEYNVFPELKDFENCAVVYFKIDNFDEITEVLQPKQIIELLNSYLPIVYKPIMKHGGNIDIFNYDEITAYWIEKMDKHQTAYEACLVAKEIIDLKDEIHAFITKKYQCNVFISVSVAYGFVYKHIIGVGDKQIRTIAGHTIDLAKQLQANAEIGTIYVNDAVVEECKETKLQFSKLKTNSGFLHKKEEDSGIYILK